MRIERAILQEKLVEREKEVDREQNYVSSLRKELKESHEVNEGALKVLNAQSQELIEKGNEGAPRIQHIENCLEQQGLEWVTLAHYRLENWTNVVRIQSLLKLFESNRANTISHSELAQSLKALQTELSES